MSAGQTSALRERNAEHPEQKSNKVAVVGQARVSVTRGDVRF